MNPRNPVFDRTSVKQSDFSSLPATSPGYPTPPTPTGLDGITLGVNSDLGAYRIDQDLIVRCPPSALSPIGSDGGSLRWDWDNELEALK